MLQITSEVGSSQREPHQQFCGTAGKYYHLIEDLDKQSFETASHQQMA